MSIIGRRRQVGNRSDGKPRRWVEPSVDIQMSSPEVLKKGLRSFFSECSKPLSPKEEVGFHRWLAKS